MTQTERGDVVVLDQTNDDNEQPAARSIAVRNALDMAPTQFAKGLERQGQNRETLMSWIRANLVEGVDYGKIHIVKRDKCPNGKNCSNPYHFSKDSLFKPGAEKIVGMMGFRAVWPRLVDYEQAAFMGSDVNTIALRCELVDRNGHVIAEGFGARSLSNDYGDWNKAVKMAKKSGLIDAVLNAGGLSEVFTQDVEDMSPDAMGDDPAFDPYNAQQNRMDLTREIDPAKAFPFGKHKGQPWAEVPLDYLEWALANMSNLAPDLVKRIEAETVKRISDRHVAPDSTDNRLDAKLDKGFEAVSEEQLAAERHERAESRPLKYYADLIADAGDVATLKDIEKEIAGTLHEKPLAVFLNERKNHFLNWQS